LLIFIFWVATTAGEVIEKIVGIVISLIEEELIEPFTTFWKNILGRDRNVGGTTGGETNSLHPDSAKEEKQSNRKKQWEEASA
jgi:hypothetical protein